MSVTKLPYQIAGMRAQKFLILSLAVFVIGGALGFLYWPAMRHARVAQVDCQTIPTEPESPSSYKIGDWLGSPVVEDTMVVVLKDSVADKQSTIRSIACKYHSQIVGSVGGAGMYELRIPGQKIDTLLPIINEVGKEPGVESAMADILSTADSKNSAR